MNKKTLYTIIVIFIMLFILGLIIYPIFYNSSDENELNNDISSEKDNEMLQIDALSNLSFFKIIVEDINNTDGISYSEKIVTIRDLETIKTLQEMIASAKLYEANEPTGYDVPTTAICYLEDNTVCNFFVADTNLLVFSDNDSNKIMYELDSKYNVDEFLTKLYNTNVNSSNYSSFEEDGKYGIKYLGKTIIQPKYDNIVIINPKVDVFAVTLDNVTTFIDKYEENTFPNFEHIELLSGTGGGESLWYENALCFKSNNKYGLSSLDGLILLPAEYDNIRALNYEKDYLIISKDKKEKVIKLSSYGYEEFTEEFDSIKILGADLDFTYKESQYLYSDATVLVGINNGIREKYFQIK